MNQNITLLFITQKNSIYQPDNPKHTFFTAFFATVEKSLYARLENMNLGQIKIGEYQATAVLYINKKAIWTENQKSVKVTDIKWRYETKDSHSAKSPWLNSIISLQVRICYSDSIEERQSINVWFIYGPRSGKYFQYVLNLSKNHICYYTFVNAEKIFNRGYAWDWFFCDLQIVLQFVIS